MFAITVHFLTVSVCSIPPVYTNRLLISNCCLLHHNACISLLVTLHLHSKLTTYAHFFLFVRISLLVTLHLHSKLTTYSQHHNPCAFVSVCTLPVPAYPFFCNCTSLLCLLHLLPSMFLFALLNECFTSFCCLCTIIPVHLFSLYYTYTLNWLHTSSAPQCLPEHFFLLRYRCLHNVVTAAVAS